MIEWFMFGALGFFLGCLLGLMLAPPLWNRAVKLTTRRLEATIPMSLADIQADKDQLRADFAIQLRKVEVALEKSKEKAARELIEANKRRVEIQRLNSNLDTAKGEVQESQNANRVLQQTIKRRLPDLDARLKAAKKALSDLETVNAELRSTVASQSEALKFARSTVHNQRADIDQLRLSLESGSAGKRGSSKSDGRAVAESQRLAAELSRAQEELEHARTSTDEIEFLRRELNNLASHIMDAARAQAPEHYAAAAPQSAAAYEDPEASEENWHTQGTMTGHQMPAEQESAAEEVSLAYAGNGAAEHTEYEAAAESPPETHHEGAYSEGPQAVATEEADETEQSFAAQETFEVEETYKAEEPFETYELEETYGNEGEDDHTDDDAFVHEDESQEPEKEKVSLSQRFTARRAKRRAEKSGGGSLTSRLRGLVPDSPERRG